MGFIGVIQRSIGITDKRMETTMMGYTVYIYVYTRKDRD